MSECNHELRYCWCSMDKIACDAEEREKRLAQKRIDAVSVENERLREVCARASRLCELGDPGTVQAVLQEAFVSVGLRTTTGGSDA